MLLNPAAMKEKSMDIQTDSGTEDHENLVKKSSNNPPKFTRMFEMVNKLWLLVFQLEFNQCVNRKKIVKPQQ